METTRIDTQVHAVDPVRRPGLIRGCIAPFNTRDLTGRYVDPITEVTVTSQTMPLYWWHDYGPAGVVGACRIARRDSGLWATAQLGRHELGGDIWRAVLAGLVFFSGDYLADEQHYCVELSGALTRVRYCGVSVATLPYYRPNGCTSEQYMAWVHKIAAATGGRVKHVDLSAESRPV